MNESISETGSPVSQAKGVTLIENQVFNRDLPASQRYMYLSQAEERQADEHIAAWEQHNAPWTLGSYLDSLRQSPETPLAFDHSFTSSSIEPDGPYGQQSDLESRLIATGPGQIPALTADQRKVPISILTGPTEYQAADSHPARIRTGPTFKLPTGEVISEQQKARRFHFVGFPPITQPLPEDIEDEAIIRHWPNHLWGPLLLGIAEKWKPLEISHMTPVNLRRNAISKRIAAARIQGGEEFPKTRWQKRKPFAREGQPLDEHEVNSHPETELEDRQATRMDDARAIGLEDVHQSDRLRKRRKSDH